MTSATDTTARTEVITEPTTRLEFLDIEITERCNLTCHHCYIRKTASNMLAKESEMSTQIVQKILDEAMGFGLLEVRFTGGEPLLRKDFCQLYSYAYDLGLEVSVSTNATLITDEIIQLWKIKRPKSVSISLYGWNNKVYQTVTGVANGFALFQEGIKRLQKGQIAFSVKCPAVPMLILNRNKMQRLARKLGYKEPLNYSWELTLHARRDKTANEKISKLRLSPEEAARARLQEPGLAAQETEALLRPPPKKHNALLSCRAGKTRMTIDAYGRLQACLELRHPETVYDLTSGTLKEALEEFIPGLRRLGVSEDYENRCGKCLLRRRCMHCPAVAWEENGTIDSLSEYYCQVMHAEARLLGLLKKDDLGWVVERLQIPR